MTRNLLPLLFLSLLLLPIGANLVPTAQTTDSGWAISAYNKNLAGYSTLNFHFMNYSYFPLNYSVYNPQTMVIWADIPFSAVGGNVQTTNYGGIGFNCIYVQAGLLFNGSFYLITRVWFLSGNTVVVATLPAKPVNYKPSMPFNISVYYSYADNAYHIVFTDSYGSYNFPGTPISTYVPIPSGGVPAVLIYDSGGQLYYYKTTVLSDGFDYPPGIQNANFFGYVLTPNVAVNATSNNPYFLVLYQIYGNGNPYNAPWNGQNLISAESGSLSSDNGSEVGYSTPSLTVAWGAREYAGNAEASYSSGVYTITYYMNVSYWLIGTEKGIEAYANILGVPVNGMANGIMITMTTSPQSYTAVSEIILSLPI